jgi:glycosyltransferase involved in cell wall biosynthesis
MKILCVVQRYGTRIIGGAELHCRLIAERLSRHHEVDIATTCAADYLTWENIFPAGTEIVNAIRVHRFPVTQRRPADFDSIAYRTLHGYPSVKEEKQYLDAQGPVCPELITFLSTASDTDRFILFSYRYWTTWNALRTTGKKAILVPTAENDRTLDLRIHKDSFHLPTAIAYNSPEERALINRVSGNEHVPGITVGVGISPVDDSDTGGELPVDIPCRFFIYIGRIEESKGCSRLIRDYMTFHSSSPHPPALVFIGKQEIPVPNHPGIFCLGIQPDAVKMHLLSQAIALIMPSRYESLSMVVLEAWKMRRPVVCNGLCDVLRGQCRRSRGGLYYRNIDEFIEILSLLSSRQDIADIMGTNGEIYYRKHYEWSVIMEKYDRLLNGLGDFP